MLQALMAGTMFFSSLVSPVSAPAHADPPPSDRMTMSVKNVIGSGCPGGSVTVTPSPDNETFTVAYSKYIAQAGAGASSADYRRNCQIAVDVHVPNGFTYAIAKVDYRGYASLQAGVSAVEQAGYYFQGSSGTVRSRHDFRGAMDDNWQVTDEVGLASLVWAPCGATRFLNINTELRVDLNGTSTAVNSQITMDSTDTTVDTVYHIAWRRC
jgi:hypothetical protein